MKQDVDYVELLHIVHILTLFESLLDLMVQSSAEPEGFIPNKPLIPSETT